MPTRRSRMKRIPAHGRLVRYQERIVEVLGEARGEWIMIRSVHADGVERRTAVKWVNLLPLDQQTVLITVPCRLTALRYPCRRPCSLPLCVRGVL